MTLMATASRRLTAALRRIQSKLNFKDWLAYPQFNTTMGLGRVAMLSCILGTLWGIHLLLALQIGLIQRFGLVDTLQDLHWWGLVDQVLEPERVHMLLQWCIYVVLVCSFHLGEFFVTAVYNPTVTSADSFLINHSVAYTAAALLSWTEFWIRFWCFPSVKLKYQSMAGLILTIVAQVIRSLAMITCGESFNHLIQRCKKENHVLVTHGIYKVLRHPSYVGFYYWAVGTQMLLGNLLNTILFALVAWLFFRRRIPYEEESLLQLFPNEYPAYRARTWIGIPFVIWNIKRR